MPKILNGREVDKTIKYMVEAAELSKSSPCATDKRGVLIVKHGLILGRGVNGPPRGFECTPEYCGESCRTNAVHAEMRAISDAVERGNNIQRARLYHARTENGELQNSGKPRCIDCSKHILEFGIEGVVLKHEEGYVLYDAEEFHELSLNYKKPS